MFLGNPVTFPRRSQMRLCFIMNIFFVTDLVKLKSLRTKTILSLFVYLFFFKQGGFVPRVTCARFPWIAHALWRSSYPMPLGWESAHWLWSPSLLQFTTNSTSDINIWWVEMQSKCGVKCPLGHALCGYILEKV